jgi:hypothetical protein
MATADFISSTSNDCKALSTSLEQFNPSWFDIDAVHVYFVDCPLVDKVVFSEGERPPQLVIRRTYRPDPE